MTTTLSYAECSARERLLRIVDPGSFHEWLPPAERLSSPHLAHYRATLWLAQAADAAPALCGQLEALLDRVSHQVART